MILLLSEVGLFAFPITAFSFSAFASLITGAFAMTALTWTAFARCCLFHGGIVVIHNDNRVAALALLMLGMARIGRVWVVRVICVLGPAFLVALVVTGFTVFDDHHLTSVAVFFAGAGTGSHRGNR